MPVTLAFLGDSIGSGEIFIVFVAILLLFGPKRLPDLARMLGRATAELRRASQDFRDEVMKIGKDVDAGDLRGGKPAADLPVSSDAAGKQNKPGGEDGKDKHDGLVG